MRRGLLRISGAFLLLASSALALTLPDHAVLTIVTSQGTVVGVGEIAGGDVELLLERSYSGPATLLLTTPNGEATVVDVMIGRSGQVVVIGREGVYDLATVVLAGGGSVEVSFSVGLETEPTAGADQLEEEGRAGEDNGDLAEEIEMDIDVSGDDDQGDDDDESEAAPVGPVAPGGVYPSVDQDLEQTGPSGR